MNYGELGGRAPVASKGVQPSGWLLGGMKKDTLKREHLMSGKIKHRKSPKDTERQRSEIFGFFGEFQCSSVFRIWLFGAGGKRRTLKREHPVVSQGVQPSGWFLAVDEKRTLSLT